MKHRKPKVLILENFYFRAKQFQDRFATFDIKDIIHVTSARECIQQISKKKLDAIFLDYDLSNAESFGTSNDTGATVAQWIKDHADNLNKKASIIIHSGNEYGAAEMKKLIPNAHVIPKAWHKDVFDQIVKLLNLET